MIEWFAEYYRELFSGVLLTVILMVSALLAGLLLAILLALMQASKYRLLKVLAQAYVFFIRGTPLLVQFFLLYFGAAQFDALQTELFGIILTRTIGLCNNYLVVK